MYKRLIIAAALALTAAVALGVTGAFGKDGGRLELYLVNSGPSTHFYNDSAAADGNCNPILAKPASLSPSKGTSLQQDIRVIDQSGARIGVLLHGARRRRLHDPEQRKQHRAQDLDVLGRRDLPRPERRPVVLVERRLHRSHVRLREPDRR
jgi:hypothetical protein